MKFRFWDVILRQEDRVIGGGGFHVWHFRHNRAEVGYHLHREEDRNKGYMTEALGAIIDYGFKEMGLNRISAFTAPDNLPSIMLLNKYGFVKEGMIRKDYLVGNHYYDSLVYGLLRTDYL